MSKLYSELALSYRQWHFRITPVGWEHFDPGAGLAALGSMNTFSLLMLLPPRSLPPWVFASIPVLVGLGLYWHICKTFSANPVEPSYARLSDAVPGFREFPLVYSYMLLSFLLFVTCLYVAIRSTA